MKRSEEYYERAILADPHDGEVLSQYAKLQWDVHKDQDRAEMYYDQAVQAAPDDWLVLSGCSCHSCLVPCLLAKIMMQCCHCMLDWMMMSR